MLLFHILAADLSLEVEETPLGRPRLPPMIGRKTVCRQEQRCYVIAKGANHEPSDNHFHIL